MSTYLVESPQAESFMELASTNTGSAAFLGDPEQFESGVGPDIANAGIALRDNVAKVAALKNDLTRTEVQKHEAAAVLAECTVQALEKAKAAIESRANELWNSAIAQSEIVFAPKSDRGTLDSEIRQYLREQAGKPDGMMKIREAMKDKNVAGVVMHSPSFLLDMNPLNHQTLKFEIMEQHLPDAYKKQTDSVALRNLPAKYDKAINSVRTSFYNPALAAKASTRVQL